MSKATWGKSKLRYCPVKKKVWQLKHDNTTGKTTVVFHKDMPTYGLPREESPNEERGSNETENCKG